MGLASEIPYADSEKIKVMYNLPDRQYIDQIRLYRDDEFSGFDSAKLNIVFTGMIYATQTLNTLIGALRLLNDTVRNCIILHYYGDASSEVTREFSEAGIIENLIDHGRVSKGEAVNALWHADLLYSVIHNDVVASSNGVKGIITTKIFDYLITGKPILNIAPDEAEIRKLISKMNLDNCLTYNSSQINEIKTCIQGLIQAKEKTYPEMQLLTWDDRYQEILSEIEG